MGSGTDWVGSKTKKNVSAGRPNSQSALENLALTFAKETTGLRTGLISQLEDIINTGGVGSRIPIISQATEASKQATSQSMRALSEDLTRSGLAGTPFGAAMTAQTRQAGNQSTSQVGANIAMQLMQMIPNLILGQAQTATSGLGTAAQGDVSMTNQGGSMLSKAISAGK